MPYQERELTTWEKVQIGLGIVMLIIMVLVVAGMITGYIPILSQNMR